MDRNTSGLQPGGAQGAVAPAALITPQSRVGELLDRWPAVVDILVDAGLSPLADAAHREMVKRLPVTLEMACANHGLDLGAVLLRLNAAVGGAAGKP